MNYLKDSAEELKSYIEETNIDLWKDTPFAGYVFMSNKNKGSFGERLLELIWKKQGDTLNHLQMQVMTESSMVIRERLSFLLQ